MGGDVWSGAGAQLCEGRSLGSWFLRARSRGGRQSRRVGLGILSKLRPQGRTMFLWT